MRCYRHLFGALVAGALTVIHGHAAESRAESIDRGKATSITIGDDRANLKSILIALSGPDRERFAGDAKQFISAVNNSPRFIFIPGVLGSKLTLMEPQPGGGPRPKEVIWGREGGLPGLMPSPGQIVAASDLRAVRSNLAATPKIPVYDEFFRHLTLMNFYEKETLVSFSYDWRKDNKESAARLDELLLAMKREGDAPRRAYFIVHSMGGLVFKYWYFTAYQPNKSKYPLDIAGVYFLGTPHRGSASGALTLYRGYVDSDYADDAIVSRSNNVVYGNLNRAGIYFPSLLELLPWKELNRVNFVGDGATTPRDPLDFDTWTGLGQFRNMDPARKQEVADAFLKAKEFIGILRRSDNQQITGARYRCSGTSNTPHSVLFRQSGGNWLLDAEYMRNRRTVDGGGGRDAGDGRVIAPDAHNLWDAAAAVPCSATVAHANLPNDPEFINATLSIRSVGDKDAAGGAVPGLLAGRANIAALLEQPAQNAYLVKAMAQKPILLSVPIGANASEATKKIDTLNALILREYLAGKNLLAKWEQNLGGAAYCLASKATSPSGLCAGIGASQEVDDSARGQLYALAIRLGLEKGTPLYYLANVNAAYQLMVKEHYEEALFYAEETRNIPNRMRSAGCSEVFGNALNTLGMMKLVTTWERGQPNRDKASEIIRILADAAAYGNEFAARWLGQLKGLNYGSWSTLAAPIDDALQKRSTLTNTGPGTCTSFRQ